MKIANAASDGEMEKAFRDAWGQRTPESKARARELNEAAGVEQGDAPLESVPGDAPTFREPVRNLPVIEVKEDGSGYVLPGPDGTVLEEHGDGPAVLEAWGKSTVERQEPGVGEIDSGTEGNYTKKEEAEHEQRSIKDPYTGRDSLVREMAQQRADETGVSGSPSIHAEATAERVGEAKSEGGKRTSGGWAALGEAFRRRDAEIHRRAEAASGRIRSLVPDLAPEKQAQRFFNLLRGIGKTSDPELAAHIAGLREEIPTLPSTAFTSLPEVGSGVEATVYMALGDNVVYKLYKITDGQAGGYVPGPIRREEDGQIRVYASGTPSFTELLGRMERSNAKGTITPAELVAVTPDGYAVFAQPFVEGLRVQPEELGDALKSLDLRFIPSHHGQSAVARVGERWILFDDLHAGNVKRAQDGGIEVIDANNRELTAQEVQWLVEEGVIPQENKAEGQMSDAVRDSLPYEQSSEKGEQTIEQGPRELEKLSVAVKLDKYLLSPEHPRGASKAKWFKEALGFTRENADLLSRQLVFDPAKAVQTLENEYGTKFNQLIDVTGVNGRVIPVKVAWIRNKDGVVRLVTVVPGD